jgi:2,4-dienoyl-CoA reductase (NADPH2)
MKLFEPISIRGMIVPNRIVYPAIQMNMGLTNRRARGFYAERARGGAGLVMTANTSVDNLACEELWGGDKELGDFISRLRLLTDQVHACGARMGLQLWMDNRFPQGRGVQIASKEADPSSGERVAPSAVEDMRALTVPEIESIIYRFAKGAANVKAAGFDCVELHGAHRYLLCQFTNPDLNKRTDKYGGTLENRMRFGLDIVRAARRFVGPDYPILFRLGALDDNGVISPDSLAYARELEKAGVDCLDISTSGYGKLPVSPVKRDKPGTLVPLAEAIKKSVKIPVIAVGKINTPDVAESILNQGRADMVAIGRQLICDPFWPQKVKEGRFKDVVTCDSCNVNCYSPAFERKLPPNAPLCKHNERVGREWEMLAKP